MNHFERFMLQAKGRDVDLEEKLKKQGASSLERLFRIIHRRELTASERQAAESLASALNSTIDDDYVIHMFLSSIQVGVAISVLNKISKTGNAVSELSETLKKLDNEKPRLDPWVVGAFGIMIVASCFAAIWTAGTIGHLSRQLDRIDAVRIVKPQIGP